MSDWLLVGIVAVMFVVVWFFHDGRTPWRRG